jgi:hypothetical protein
MWKLVVVALLIVSCKSADAEKGLECTDQTGAPLNGGLDTEQLGGECTATGSVPVGSPCTAAKDCVHACCSCGLDAGNTISVGYCMHVAGGTSVCATPSEACCVFDLEQAKPDASQACK